MVRALARKKASREKPSSSVRPTKKVGVKVTSESSASRKSLSTKKDQKRAQKKRVMKAEKKGTRHSKPSVSEATRSMNAEARKSTITNRITPAPEIPPRLLRDSKSTTAALNLLEKGIRLIYQKEFKRARVELKSLIEAHPGEAEIVARARSYSQICEREEAAHKKPQVANDQLYTLGVMEHNRGNYDEAIAHFNQSLENHPDADYIYYSIAASLAMKGSVQEAIQNLRKAIELSEDNRIYAKNDDDFFTLQSHKEFTDLVGVSPAANHESQ
ncbi:MAG TPA: tetratricopeptide repeat protein [Acidobacteriota bacterium]|nr:tetratricopeptide repeat protein [Acidobacteriota bacterium]